MGSTLENRNIRRSQASPSKLKIRVALNWPLKLKFATKSALKVRSSNLIKAYRWPMPSAGTNLNDSTRWMHNDEHFKIALGSEVRNFKKENFKFWIMPAVFELYSSVFQLIFRIHILDSYSEFLYSKFIFWILNLATLNLPRMQYKLLGLLETSTCSIWNFQIDIVHQQSILW